MQKYFKGLDVLRAITPLAIIWGHIEILKNEAGIPNLIDRNFPFFPQGHIRVMLFFVLSGFIITYLLIMEKNKKGRICIKSFYIKRFLRIIPLYYLIMLLSYYLFREDYNHYSITSVLLNIGLMSNIAFALGMGWPYSPQIWSIGAIEQFYLVLPLILSLIPDKRIILALFLFFVGYTLLPHILVDICPDKYFGKIVFNIYYATKFNCMALGAIAGYMIAKEFRLINILGHSICLYLAILLLIILLFFHFQSKYFNDEIYAVIFTIIIIGIASNNTITKEFSFFSFLSKISYGIYIYHWIIILLVIKYVKYTGNIISYNITLYSVVIFSTIIVSWLSYLTIEKLFRNIRDTILKSEPVT